MIRPIPSVLSPTFAYHVFKQLSYYFSRSAFDLKIINKEKLVEDGPCVIVMNHQSFLDPPILGQLFEHRVFAIGRHSLWDSKILGFALDCVQVIPINQTRPDPNNFLKIMRLAEKGERIAIFPEGSRTPDGEIKDAQAGIGLILSKLNGIRVQPLRIHGAYEALPIHAKKVNFNKISVTVGDPFVIDIPASGPDRRKAQRAIGAKVMDAIRALPTEC